MTANETISILSKAAGVRINTSTTALIYISFSRADFLWDIVIMTCGTARRPL